MLFFLLKKGKGKAGGPSLRSVVVTLALRLAVHSSEEFITLIIATLV